MKKQSSALTLAHEASRVLRKSNEFAYSGRDHQVPLFFIGTCRSSQREKKTSGWRYKAISELMINGQIGDREIRLIGSHGEQIGIMNSRDALRMAKEQELDLVLIAPAAKPPVCKIIDYGKYRYEMARKEKDAKKKQKTIEIKEVRLSPNIEDNDLNTKANAARKFLEKGDKVKVSLRYRGREMSHMSQTRHVLDDFAESLSDIAVVDKPSKMEGRSLVMFLRKKG